MLLCLDILKLKLDFPLFMKHLEPWINPDDIMGGSSPGGKTHDWGQCDLLRKVFQFHSKNKCQADLLFLFQGS